MVELTPVDTTGLQEKYDDWVAFVAKTHHGSHPRANPEAPFTPLAKPLAECRVALLTTAGAHLDDQPPFHTETVAGDQSYRIIPDGADLTRMRFSHTHYDTSSAEKDTNVVLPIDRLHELVESGRIGSSSPVHIGMMGFNPDPSAVADDLAPAVAGVLRDAEVDVAILVPG
jgi:D-proline reductase (dithiol) PrdB